jgi:hypothetical protein
MQWDRDSISIVNMIAETFVLETVLFGVW